MVQRVSYFLLILFLTACSGVSSVKVRDGKTAYDTKQYAVAVKLLRSEYSKADTRLERGRLAYMLGESYKALQQGIDAAEWYQKAYDNSYGVEALKEAAYMLKATEQYVDAAATFRDLGFEIGSPYEYRKDILACELAQKWQKSDRQEYQVTLADFNSAKADYAPFPFVENTLVFTSDRATSTGDKTYNWTGNDFSDLFQVDLISGDVSSFSKVLNTDSNEGTATFSRDQKTIFFTRCAGEKKLDQYCNIYYADWNGRSWSELKVLPFTKPEVNYMHPILSPNGAALYFSSNDPEGFGGYDIFVSEKQRNGEWGTPRPLSATINTAGNEQFPTFHNDTLYFSSNRHTSIGGLDVFKTNKMANGAWSPVNNLQAPINSGGDDFGLIIMDTKGEDEDILQVGYLSSSRMGGLGGDDIYRFEKRKLPPLPDPPVVETAPEEAKLILEVYVVEGIYEDPLNPNSAILGRRPIPQASIDITLDEKVETVETDEEGKYRLELEVDKAYEFLASKPEYLRNKGSFSSQGLRPTLGVAEQIFEVEIQLEKIFLNQEIVLENIYYDFEEDYIREDAEPTLDELAATLQLNPEIVIEMSSHTDCRGSLPFNQNLSQRRAQSAVDYLASKGIDKSRLEAKGYGETDPSNDCVCSRCTEDEHQENRRTAFKILQ